ncbi:hypothetical protein M8J75_010017 [Diaphorina citri]|nr:hypothetical protein M8J75_010017 [Diaphorina citri]
MADSQASRAEKLIAARKKLKEFQEQKRLREKSSLSPVVNNENVEHATSGQNESQQNIEKVSQNERNDENIVNQHSFNNSNTVQYFMPNTQQILSNNETNIIQNNQGFNNVSPFNSNNTQNINVPSQITNQNSNDNSTMDIKAYFSDNIYQPNHSLEHSRNNSFYNESLNKLQAEKNINQNVANLIGNVNSNRFSVPHNNNAENSDFTFQQSTNNGNNINISFETTNDNGNNFATNDNSPLNTADSGNTQNINDTGNTNYNILSVFTDSSNTSSHGSSTHTGPFLLNEEIPQQQVNSENSVSQASENSSRNDQPPCDPTNSNGTHEGYHLFEQTHNENYFGINFGNEQGPGIHMNVNPFEHRNEKMVSDFLNSEASTDTDQTNAQERLLPSSSEELSGTSTVSKSVSLESSAGGGGGVYFDDLMMKPSDSTNSSTVFSSCDNIRKLLSSAAESSSEPACTNSHCEEACMLEMEKRNEELSALLSGEQNKSDQLEAQVAQLKSEVHALHGALAEKDKYYASAGQDLQQQIKSQTHTIQILIEEKNQLDARLNASGDAVEAKNREMDELKGRLAISKHKSANMERDMMVLQEQMKQEKKLLQETTAALSQERKQLEDLAEDKVELTHKFDTKSKELQQVQILLQERDSQLSLMHLKVQQLSAAGGMQSSDVTSDVLSLQQERDQLKSNVTELSEHLKALTRERDKTVQYHVQMIDSLKAKNEELTTLYTGVENERSSLLAQCQNQIQHIADLEKQIQNLREAVTGNQSQDRTGGDESALKPLVAEMENKIKDLTIEKQKLDTALQAQVLETELAQERIDQLTREVEKLEADRPDATALLSAMESDKIAASRAVQQNSVLKQQLQELQDALIAMNNAKLELTEQLSQEQVRSNELQHALQNLQQQMSQIQEYYQQQSQQNSQQEVGQQVEPASDPVDQNALRQLEEKFKMTMTELAELSDEKQRLEHLVTQLQLETETIGEYAALYQKQRYLLQQKSREKDEQVKQLSKDQEALKQKLAKLNALVQDYVTNRSDETLQHGVTALLEASGATDAAQSSSATVAPPVDSKATQIMELISEIGANSLVDGGVPSSFHPCPVCSGQLITV